jgi:hypothetical protein
MQVRINSLTELKTICRWRAGGQVSQVVAVDNGLAVHAGLADIAPKNCCFEHSFLISVADLAAQQAAAVGVVADLSQAGSG